VKPVNLLLVIAALLLPAPESARGEAPPDMEMLEFLGSFETARGKPIDPRALAEMPRKSAGRERSPVAEKNGKQRPAADKLEKKDRDDEK